MTDHDQTLLDLMRERTVNARQQTLIAALCIALIATCAGVAVQAYARGRDIAALTAKCGLEAR